MKTIEVGDMPPRIAKLPRDERGYPIPWNVLIDDNGVPAFTVNDTTKHMDAIVFGLCPLCGERLGKYRWFVGGPQSAFDPNGWYFDLPGHKECEEFALRVCPWLSARNYEHRVDLLPRMQAKTSTILVDVTQDPNRPILFVAVCSDKMEVMLGSANLPYVRPKKPILGVQYWQHGKQLSDEEGKKITEEIMKGKIKNE